MVNLFGNLRILYLHLQLPLPDPLSLPLPRPLPLLLPLLNYLNFFLHCSIFSINKLFVYYQLFVFCVKSSLDPPAMTAEHYARLYSIWASS